MKSAMVPALPTHVSEHLSGAPDIVHQLPEIRQLSLQTLWTVLQTKY
jgi:hypothetical protein